MIHGVPKMRNLFVFPRVELIYGLLFVVGCTPPPNEAPVTAAVSVENNEQNLASRISYPNTILELDTTQLNQKPKSAVKAALPLLTLVAEVAPPTVGGTSLQATEVQISGNRAYVGYNVQGETFLGAVEIFDITDTAHPTLVSKAVFTDADVNGLFVTGNDLFLAAATSDASFSKPAALMHMTLVGGKLADSFTRVGLPSYAGTDVAVSGNNVYASSGADNGYVTVLNKSSLAVTGQFALADARGLAVENNTVVAVAGTPGRLIVFDTTISSQTAQYSLSGASIAFSKSTVEVVGGKAFLGMGDGGTQLVCVASGALLGQIARPTVAGLDASVTVTNAVTADKSVLFMANGEAGVYMATSDKAFTSNECDTRTLTMEGKLKFSANQSVNHVTYRSGVLFIASGIGGLKIVSVKD